MKKKYFSGIMTVLAFLIAFCFSWDVYGSQVKFRFSKLDGKGSVLPPDAAQWVMVKDNRNGLIWEVKTTDGSIHDKHFAYPWDKAGNVFIKELNETNFGGYTDWRLPRVEKLASLLEASACDPSIDTDFFPSSEESAWYEVSSGLPEGRILSIQIDPAISSILYTVIEDNGIFKSVDGGDSWFPIMNGIPSNQAHSLVIHPERPEFLYAYVNAEGVFKSGDGGASWVSLVNFPYGSGRVLGVLPMEGDELYIHNSTNGLMKSFDGGEHWEEANTGLERISEIRGMVMDSDAWNTKRDFPER
ncbi:MAG: DUF1566 domain-containing protein [Desulfobacteraceae bacterium]